MDAATPPHDRARACEHHLDTVAVGMPTADRARVDPETSAAAAPRTASAQPHAASTVTAALPLTAAPSRTDAEPETLADVASHPTPVNAVTVDAADLRAIAEAPRDDPETAAFSNQLTSFPRARRTPCRLNA